MNAPVDRLPTGRLIRWVLLAFVVAVAVVLYFQNAKHAAPLLTAPEPSSTTTP